MSYIGNTSTTQSFTPAIDYFSGNGSTVSFTLSRPVASSAQVQVVVNNVPQNPSTAFTVLNSTITFTGAPSSGTNNIYVEYVSTITQVMQPGQGTVGATQIADNAITTAKIAAGAVVPADLSTGGPYWDTSGNVGIGTSSPASKLDVSGQIRSTGVSPNPTNGVNTFAHYGSGSFGGGYGLLDGTNAWGMYAQSGSLVFSNSASGGGSGALTSRVSIDSSGNLLVGTTSNLGKLSVGGNIGTDGTQFNIYATNNYEFVHRNAYRMNFYVNSASVMASLSITGVWTNASDARYKENIVDSQYGLSTVMALKPRAYNLIDQTDKPQIGFIAQEVLEVVPEVVESVYNSVTEEDRYTLSYGNLTAVLTKAIQEQQALITTLTERITALEAK